MCRKWCQKSAEPLCSLMTWKSLLSWYMHNKLRSRNSRRSSGRQKGLTLVILIFLTQGLIDKVVLDSIKGFTIKVRPMVLLSSTKIRCLTLRLKEVKVLDFHFLVLIALSVKTSTMVSDQATQMVVIVVVKVVTK